MPLLDRLNLAQKPFVLPEDIALNLERVLNTRRGVVPQDAGMGLAHRPAINLAKDRLLAEELILAIKEQVTTYEPRIQASSLKLEVVGKNLVLTGLILGQQPPQSWLLTYQTDNYLSVLPGAGSHLEKVTEHV